MQSKIATALAAFVLVAFAGCTATQQGAVAGTALGAGAGAIIGNQSGDSGEGALIGGAVGGISGGLIGHALDQNRQSAPAPTYQYERVGPPAIESPPTVSTTDTFEGNLNSKGRLWVPEHEEVWVRTAPNGTTYEQRVLVPGHYE